MITVIGSHKVKHGDLMQGIEDLMQNDLAELVYSDPPWGAGNLNYWQTINKRMTGAEPKETNLDLFLNKVFETASKYSKNIVLIEYGIKWREMIKERGAKYGLIHKGIADLKYYSGSRLLPLDLHVFAKTDINLPKGYLENLKDTYGLTTLRNAIEPFKVPGGIILDPCCGMGYTAQIALETGMSFRGNELNAKRLSKTINRLNEKKKRP